MAEASPSSWAPARDAGAGPDRATDRSRVWAWRPVAAPADVVWAILADTASWPRWGPSVRAVEPHAGLVTTGLTGRVRTPAGVRLPFVIDEVDPGRSWRWTVAGVVATDHVVEPTGPASCRVGIGVPRPARPYLVVCRVALGRIARLAEAAA